MVGMEQEDAERPRKRSGSDKRRLSIPLTVRYSPDQLARITEAAGNEGITAPAWVRKVSVNAPIGRRSRKRPVDHALLAQLLAAIGHVGGNINQLAHAANVGGFEAVRAGPLREAADHVAEIHALLMQALGYAPRLSGDTGETP
jgi:hypothetical protein